MPVLTDCQRRRVRTIGCACLYCRDRGALADGEALRVSTFFRDHKEEIRTMTNATPLTSEQLRHVDLATVDRLMLGKPSPAFADGLAAGARVTGSRPDLEAVAARRQASYDAYSDRLAGRDGAGDEQDAYGAYRRRLADAWRSQAA